MRRLELIRWQDHHTESEDWTPVDAAKSPDFGPLICESVGWVLAENAECVRLAANRDGDSRSAENVFGTFVILKSAIVTRVPLKPAPRKGSA